jgi:hypothetical protein
MAHFVVENELGITGGIFVVKQLERFDAAQAESDL